MFKLVTKNISKTFSNNTLFKNLDFELTQGDFLLIHGPNGSGKSTLLKTLIGIITKDTGSQNIESEDLKSSLGYISTNHNSFFNRLTVHENLLFFLRMRGYETKECIEMIRLTLNEFKINSEILNKKYMHLSSGERKKVSVLRCFSHNPTLLILDEPMSGLDYENKKILLKKISNMMLNKNKIFIVVSHNINLYKNLFTHKLEMKLNSSKLHINKVKLT